MICTICNNSLPRVCTLLNQVCPHTLAGRERQGVQPKHTFLDDRPMEEIIIPEPYTKPINSGLNGNYYKIPGTDIECNDIIEALQMNFAEGNAMKALIRKANARLGNAKENHSPLYDAEKVLWSGQRLVAQETKNANQRPNQARTSYSKDEREKVLHKTGQPT